MPQRPRTTVWKHNSGQDATVVAISNVFGPILQQITAIGTHIYDSTCMKTGTNVQLLLKNSFALLPFIQLDPKGGYFGQLDMVAGMEMAFEKTDDAEETLRGQIYAKADLHMEHGDEAIKLTIFKIRVMLAHMRLIFDSGASETSLQPLLQYMDAAGKVG